MTDLEQFTHFSRVASTAAIQNLTRHGPSWCLSLLFPMIRCPVSAIRILHLPAGKRQSRLAKCLDIYTL